MPKHLIAIPAGASLPATTGLPEGSPYALEGTDGTVAIYILKSGVWISSGGSSGGGVSYGRFLPIDETTMAHTTELNPDTATGSGVGPFSPATDPAALGVSLHTFLTGAAITTPIDGGTTFGGATSPAHAVRDVPATAKVFNAGRMNDGVIGQANCFHLAFSPRTTTPVRVDFFYRCNSPSGFEQTVSFFTWAFDETGRSVTGQFSDGDPGGAFGEWGDDPNDGSTLWADGPFPGGSGWLPASFTMPAGVMDAWVGYDPLPGFQPAGTDDDMFLEIAYMRFTPVKDGTANGELFIEQASQAQWLWDTKIEEESGTTGLGWLRMREGKVVTISDDFDVDAAANQSRLFLGLTAFDYPCDTNENRLGLALNDRAPIILTGQLTSGLTTAQALKVAGSTPTGFVVPPGFDNPYGRLAVVTFIADQTLTGNVVLSISRTDTSGVVTNPWPGLTSAANLNQRTTDSRSSGYFNNGPGQNGSGIKDLKPGDILKFTLQPTNAPGTTTNVQVALYFGGLVE